MSCNLVIHNELNNMGELTCPFCDTMLQDISVVHNNESVKHSNICCDKQDMYNDEGMNVCTNCGSVYGYDQVNEFIDFHNDMFKIRRKSIYKRKYHIENVIADFRSKNNIHRSQI